MTRIVIDDATKEKLQGLKTPLVLVDTEGHVLARVMPIPDPALYEGLESPLSAEELAERLRYEGKTYSTEEVREMLRKR